MDMGAVIGVPHLSKQPRSCVRTEDPNTWLNGGVVVMVFNKRNISILSLSIHPFIPHGQGSRLRFLYVLGTNLLHRSTATIHTRNSPSQIILSPYLPPFLLPLRPWTDTLRNPPFNRVPSPSPSRPVLSYPSQNQMSSTLLLLWA